MQIVGPSFAHLPNGHRHAQQSPSVPRVGSQAAHPLGGSGDAEDTTGSLKERLLPKPPSVGACAGEPGGKSPPSGKRAVQSDGSSSAESQVVRSGRPLEVSSLFGAGSLLFESTTFLAVITSRLLQDILNIIYKIRGLSYIIAFIFFQNVPHGGIPSPLEGQPQKSRLPAASESLPTTSFPPAPAANTHLQLLLTSAIPNMHRFLPAANAFRPDGGFPLLQFQPKHKFKPLLLPAGRAPPVPCGPLPQPREAWGPSASSQPPLQQAAAHPPAGPHPGLSRHNAGAMPKAAGQERGTETVVTETPKHVTLDQRFGQEHLTPQQDSSVFVKPEKVFDVKPGPLETSAQNSCGFPLLHLQLRPPCVFPSVSRAPVPVPSAPLRAAAEGSTHPGLPGLPLLPSRLPQEGPVSAAAGALLRGRARARSRVRPTCTPRTQGNAAARFFVTTMLLRLLTLKHPVSNIVGHFKGFKSFLYINTRTC